ncbi:hypothetical protein PG996_014232 [Apiospora saccharicola]|uniref:Uncharacterized protein n=1 Tax=Apiospora saccharicola TaxID=335842 RepID=A0ABR1THR5_9PEZI
MAMANPDAPPKVMRRSAASNPPRTGGNSQQGLMRKRDPRHMTLEKQQQIGAAICYILTKSVGDDGPPTLPRNHLLQLQLLRHDVVRGRIDSGANTGHTHDTGSNASVVPVPKVTSHKSAIDAMQGLD